MMGEDGDASESKPPSRRGTGHAVLRIVFDVVWVLAFVVTGIYLFVCLVFSGWFVDLWPVVQAVIAFVVVIAVRVAVTRSRKRE